MSEVIQVLGNLSEIMTFMAPNLGGSIPAENSEEYNQWRLAIQLKQEEASRRGYWRRLLTKEIIPLRTGDTEVTMPIRFQRANALYVFAITNAQGDQVDLADPDRIPDGQGIFAEMINDTEDEEFGYWKLNFNLPIESDQDAILWYWASPTKPVATTDKVMLPGDMIAFGAMSEIFRISNLSGSQDDARNEYESRLSTYMAMEAIPTRNEILQFVTNPRKLNRTDLARNQYLIRKDRIGRSY